MIIVNSRSTKRAHPLGVIQMKKKRLIQYIYIYIYIYFNFRGGGGGGLRTKCSCEVLHRLK